MNRTAIDIFIRYVTIEQAKNVVLSWFAENKVKVMINTFDYVYGRLGRGILTAPKFFAVTLVPTVGGVVAKTEGWIAYIPRFLPPAYVLKRISMSQHSLMVGFRISKA